MKSTPRGKPPPLPQPPRLQRLLLGDVGNRGDARDRFAFLFRRGVLDMPDVDNSTPITNGQVLVYNSTSKTLKPGAN